MRKIVILFLTLGLLLAGCSVSDLSDTGTVQVSMAGVGESGRYIANDGSTVTKAYLGLIEEDVLYNFDEVEDIEDFTGQFLFTGIPVGDYSFLALLMDSADHVVAAAIEPVTIEEGLNNLAVEMGPGFTLEFGGLDFELDDLGDEFTVTFNGDEITIGISVDDLVGGLASLASLEIKVAATNAKTIEVLNWSTDTVYAEASYSSPGESSYADATFNINALNLSPQFRIRMTSWETVDDPNFPDEKGYRDYKLRLEFN